MTDKGAHWFRCDLQVHSPRDRNWQGAERISDGDRDAYAALLVAACRERGLQGIAVTDHHDLAFVDYVRRAALDEVDDEGAPLLEEKRLVVFPGMELTLGVPCQALLIFDAEFPSDLFALAMAALPITPNAAAESKTADTLKLPRFRGHRAICVRGVHDGQNQTSLRT
jgi:type III restriction enzyme